ncbi:MAG: BrnT family toxin [Coriobacteriia bacterium]|nr:BrnT family toxin [Coriobacteriia bacterium]
MVYYLYWCPDGWLHVFEFDAEKSRANEWKHGIDFVEAQELWGDERRYDIPARPGAEVRRMAIGAVAGRIWTAVYTRRGERIRVISVRRARREEIRSYEAGEDHS